MQKGRGAMKVLLLDEDRQALEELEGVLRAFADVEIVETCRSPGQAMDLTRLHKPDVIFMEVQLRSRSGLRAAYQLLSLHPSMQIVFVTADARLALLAYDLPATDYLIKPACLARVEQTMHRLRLGLPRGRRNLEAT
ncbi:response regulator [Paenibacillus sp. IB182496]|uniref:Response regulator n=1 Tax=Paenibacillus sabuli TaxID=2772509 RepID=A0A927BR03_9BACL|nr:response regulator [Paenibacillus sabuli]MBD2844105.1 response regulator [Paenibacillus sabuli]